MNHVGVGKVVGMDWRFGVTAATDSTNQDGSTFLRLKLLVSKGNGKVEDLLMELTLPQFYQFLAQMENAKASLDFVS
eukprot:CAMPEP_0113943842 /NCGR_PEP_ID=MMETSP1339-20121228/28589_1 /TAXON_ID=94617 /ORGANISM="Fibrocapsa japonica" /LENGTH=76 /DNA_ID=CAMNT_0000948813 /DNA_START=119 /DNA_END=349 /DNA_ORIENTATION=+ /assembly_acc=CAM_ASM_000762